MYFALGIFVPKSLNDKISAYKRFLHDYYCISWTMRKTSITPSIYNPQTVQIFRQKEGRAYANLSRFALQH